MLTGVYGIVIQYNSILLVQKNGLWLFPGGKLNKGESDIACLLREFREELSDTEIEDARYYKTFRGITPFTKKEIEAKIYFAYSDGEIGEASAEIQDRRFAREPLMYSLTNITRDAVMSLIKDGYLPNYKQ